MRGGEEGEGEGDDEVDEKMEREMRSEGAGEDDEDPSPHHVSVAFSTISISIKTRGKCYFEWTNDQFTDESFFFGGVVSRGFQCPVGPSFVLCLLNMFELTSADESPLST